MPIYNDSPRDDQALTLRAAALESLRRREGSKRDPLTCILPGHGNERTTEEMRALVGLAIGREVIAPAALGHANVSYLRSQLRRWAHRQEH